MRGARGRAWIGASLRSVVTGVYMPGVRLWFAGASGPDESHNAAQTDPPVP